MYNFVIYAATVKVKFGHVINSSVYLFDKHHDDDDFRITER